MSGLLKAVAVAALFHLSLVIANPVDASAAATYAWAECEIDESI